MTRFTRTLSALLVAGVLAGAGATAATATALGRTTDGSDVVVRASGTTALRSFAERGSAVVVATHSDFVKDQSDRVLDVRLLGSGSRPRVGAGR